VLFNSNIFVFVFLPVTLIGFFMLGARGWQRLAIAWLVLASAVFYGWFKSEYLALSRRWSSLTIILASSCRVTIAAVAHVRVS